MPYTCKDEFGQMNIHLSTAYRTDVGNCDWSGRFVHIVRHVLAYLRLVITFSQNEQSVCDRRMDLNGCGVTVVTFSRH